MRPDLQEIVDELARLVGGPVTLEDRTFTLVAFGPHGTGIDQVRQQSILQRRSTPEVRRWFEQFGISTAHRAVRVPASDEHGSLARVCLPARWKGITYGYLWLIDDGSVAEEDLASAMQLADRAGRLMAHRVRAREDVELLVQDLLSTNSDTVPDAAERVYQLDLVGRGVPIAVVDLRQRVLGKPWPGPLHLWTLPRSVLTYAEEDHATLLVALPGGDADDARALAARGRELCLDLFDDRSGVEVVAGVGGLRWDLADVLESLREARLVTRVLASVPGLGTIGTWSKLGVYRLLAAGPERLIAEAVLDPAVRRLLAHSDDQLRDTARTYLELAGNVQRSAARLNVHRQTIYQRLQRIEQITGLDLGSGGDRLLLHLGLALSPLLPVEGGPQQR